MRTLKFSYCLLLIIASTALFSTKLHINNLSEIPARISYIPDIAGYVNIQEADLNKTTKIQSIRETPTVMNGFPLSYTSSNTYNGAVFTNMDDDEELEILFGVGTKIVAFDTDGTAVPGWPVSLSFYIWGSPAIGDIDGDGEEEIVCTSRNNTNGNTGALYAFNKDGSAVEGFPVTQAGGGTMNVALADITGDNAMEILVNVRNHPNGWVYVYNGSGVVVEGWPQQLDTFPGAGISAGDINNDGNTEIIALSYNSLYVYDYQGNVLDGFPLNFPGITYSYSSPVIVDLDDDNSMEIIFGGCGDTEGVVYVINSDGTIRDGWPQATSSWVFSTIAIGDVDADGELDLVVGDQVSSSEPANYIYAWDKDGNALTGFPAGPVNAVYTQVALADIDGNNDVDIVFSSNLFAEGYHCYNHDGSPKDGWPLPVGTGWDSVTMSSTPVIGDFNGDGNLNIAGASTGFTSWVVELYLWETNTNYNEDLAYMVIDGCNIQHNGIYKYEESHIIPDPPTNLNADIQGSNVILTWEYPFDMSVDYNVYRDDLLLTESPISDAFYADLSVQPGTYIYGVTAIYEGQESLPVTLSITIEEEIIITDMSWNEQFENDVFPPTGWMLIDNDGDTYNWFLFEETNGGYNSDKCAASASYLNEIGALTPDNWLITPAIVIPTNPYGSLHFAFEVAPQDSSWISEHFSVLISTTDREISSFETIYTDTINSSDWIPVIIDIYDYAEETIYIAIRHFDVTDMFYIKIDNVHFNEPMSNSEITIKPTTTVLKGNYPNPFNPETTISYSLENDDYVNLDIYNIKGQKVKSVVNEKQKAGNYNIIWNGKDENNQLVGNGIYFYKIKSGKYTATRKMILLK
jgi:hypothetical protein